MRNIFMVFILAFATISGQAQEKKNRNAKHAFEVYGNCDQCKKRIEKAAFSVDGVKSADYDLEHQTLHIIVNEEKASVADVKAAVAKAGHDTDDVKATDKDYDALHHCCKYERK
jgi:mercuric ion binding protein